MSHPSRRAVKVLKYAVIPAALLASGAVVSQASYSAYSASTSNPTSNWTTGTVNLADDDTSTALFTASALKPGSTGTKCIAVTSTGSLASSVKLYGTAPATTKALASYINLAITQGAGGSFGSCTGFTPAATNPTVYSGTVDNLGTSSTSYATGLGTWTPIGSGSETQTYRIVYTVSSTAPDSTQGGTAALGLTWEAQNS